MPRSKLTASQLQEQYGDVLASAPFRDCASAYLLQRALASRQPPVEVSLGAVTVWWGSYRVPEGAVTVASAQELEETYGDSIRHVGLEHPTAYKLRKALRQRAPPLCITNKTAEAWLKTYARQCELQSIENAGHLETLYGERIRSDAPPDLTADALQRWLLKEHAVSVRTRICQTFLTRTWSSSGRTLTPDALEEAAGERLRLQEYADRFTSDAVAVELATALAESQPPLQVSALILR